MQAHMTVTTLDRLNKGQSRNITQGAALAASTATAASAASPSVSEDKTGSFIVRQGVRDDS